MDFRVMTLEDYDQVYALWLRTPGMGLNDTDDSREGIAKYLARNPSTCFVAVENGTIVGVIMAGHDGRRGYISHTAVDSEHRGHGIGRNLVDRMMDAMKAEGINKVNLVAFSRNINGNAFWEKLGFSARTDLTYRDKTLREMVRIDT